MLTQHFKGPSNLALEFRTIRVAIYEIALYSHACPSVATSQVHAAHLWTLLSLARQAATFSIEITNAEIQQVAGAYFELLWYNFLTLIKFVLLPSTATWDSVAACKHTATEELIQQIIDKIRPMSRTGHEPADGVRDPWSYFYRFMGGMLIWLKRRDMLCSADKTKTSTDHVRVPEFDRRLFQDLSSNEIFQSQCASLAPLAEHNAELTSPDGCRGAAAATDSPVITPEHDPDPMLEFWDDSEWQRMLDEFSLMQSAPLAAYNPSAFATHGFPGQCA